MQGFPFSLVKPSILDFGTLLRESNQFTNTSIAGNNSAGSLSVGTVLGSVAAPVGSNLWVDTITMTSDIDATVWVQRGNANLIANAAAPCVQPVCCGPSFGAAIIPINSLLMEGESVSFVLRSVVDSGAGSNTFNFRGGVGGRRITNDLAYESPKTMLVIGDSITNTTGPTSGFEFYHTRTALELKSITKHYRRIVKGDGGWKTSHALDAMRRGVLSISDPDLITIMLGTNETVVTDYQTNMTQLIEWLVKFYPSAKICIFGPPPRQDSVEISVMVPIRSWAQSFVAGSSNQNLHFTSLADSFDRTDANNYVASDGAAGTRVHPTGTAHGLMAQTIISEWTSSGFTDQL